MQDLTGKTVLHQVAYNGNLELIKRTLASLPESQRSQVVSVQDILGRTALHLAVDHDTHEDEAIKNILALLPESQRLHVLCLPDKTGETVLHRVARSDHSQLILPVLKLLPELQRSRAVFMLDRAGLCSDRQTRAAIFNLLPEMDSSSEKRSCGEVDAVGRLEKKRHK